MFVYICQVKILIVFLNKTISTMKRKIVFTLILVLFIQNSINIVAKDVVFNIVVPVPTYQCWIVGNYNGWNVSNATKCQKMDFTHYKVVLNDSGWVNGINTENVEYKYLAGNGDWAYAEKALNGLEVPIRKYNQYKTDTIAGWNYNYGKVNTEGFYWMDIYVQTPPNTKECYIIGSFNNWGVPDENCKFDKYDTNLDGTVFFLKRIFLDNKLAYTYHFCSGPGLEFEQALPEGDFKYPNILPIVKSWKKIYQTDISEINSDPTKVYCKDKMIIIDGTKKDDFITICSLNGSKLLHCKSNGERIIFEAKSGILYIVNTGYAKTKIFVY